MHEPYNYLPFICGLGKQPVAVKWTDQPTASENGDERQQPQQHYSDNIMPTELPPIRQDSTLSTRTYSRENLLTTSSPPNGVIANHRDKPFLTVNCSPSSLRETPPQQCHSPYSPTRRNRFSPGSQNSSSSKESKGYSSQNTASLPITRNKSWATSDSTGAPKQTLETVIEQNRGQLATNGTDSGVESYGPVHLNNSSILNHRVDKQNSSMKPPNERRESLKSSTINAPLAGRRHPSTSNLTDNSNGKNNNTPQSTAAIGSLKKPIQRIRSDTNMANSGPRQNIATANQNASYNKQRTGGMTRVKSQPVFSAIEHDMNSKNTRKNSKHSKNEVKGGDDSFDSNGEEPNDRIVQWLMGVEKADTPPESDDIDDAPIQTDTAIHVVYTGD